MISTAFSKQAIAHSISPSFLNSVALRCKTYSMLSIKSSGSSNFSVGTGIDKMSSNVSIL